VEIFLILLKKIILLLIISTTLGMDHSSEIKKEQLRKKLNKQRKENGLEDIEQVNDDSIFNMINQVNKTLKENPEMVKKISKCINNVFDNKDLMSSLISEVETNIVNNPDSDSDSDSENNTNTNVTVEVPGQVDQDVGNMGPTGDIILETSSEKELPDAAGNDSKQ